MNAGGDGTLGVPIILFCPYPPVARDQVRCHVGVWRGHPLPTWSARLAGCGCPIHAFARYWSSQGRAAACRSGRAMTQRGNESKTSARSIVSPTRPAVHVICGNLSTRKAPAVQRRSAGPPTVRAALHPGRRLMDQLGRWFAELQRRCLEHGVFCSLEELTSTLQKWVKLWNQAARPFVWTRTRRPDHRPDLPLLLTHLHLADGQPRRMMAAWHRCRAMSVASTARSQHGAASRNAWRRARDFPSECGGLHTAVHITARRPAKRCLRDIAWQSVTAANSPRGVCPAVSGDVRSARRMLPLFPGERPCGREAMPGLVGRGMRRWIPAGMAARCKRPVERPGELPARGRPSRRSQRPSRAQASWQLQASLTIGCALWRTADY